MIEIESEHYVRRVARLVCTSICSSTSRVEIGIKLEIDSFWSPGNCMCQAETANRMVTDKLCEKQWNPPRSIMIPYHT
jgi:hypothetical protein